jgi:MFS family permease
MKYKRNIILDYFHTFFRSFNVTQAMWLIFLFNRGFSIFEIALFEGIFHITSVLFEIPTGAIADMFGRKTSRIIGIVSFFVYIAIILSADSFGFVALGFVFCALSYVFESGAAEAIVYDTLIELEEEEKFMKFMGNKEVIFQVSGFFSMLVGGTIALINYDMNFYVTGGFFFVALIMILFMKEVPIHNQERMSVKEQVKKQFIVSFRTVFQNKRLFLLIIIGAMMTAPTTTVFFFFQNYFDAGAVPIYLITMYIGLHSGGSAIGGIFASKLEKRFGEKKILYIVPLIISVSFWLILIPKITLVPFIILGVMDSIFYIVLVDYMNKMVASDVRATVLSVFGMMFSVIMIIIFTLVGYIIDIMDFASGFLMLAIIVTVFYGVLVFILRNNHLAQHIIKE